MSQLCALVMICSEILQLCRTSIVDSHGKRNGIMKECSKPFLSASELRLSWAGALCLPVGT